ncbi:MAG: glucuronate isomerase [Planctomycetia bacterium]|nr:glucuronate isomerase [Planctomycetia bacterium]
MLFSLLLRKHLQWFAAESFGKGREVMEDAHINTLSDLGLLARFVGMVTDSRSFLSYPRHEYFRRILCDLVGADVSSGRLPSRRDWLEGLIASVCYANARDYFDF